MIVLVTGAGGFLGQRVVRSLHAQGHRVRAMLRPAAVAADLENLDGVDVVRADLRSPGQLEGPLGGADAVVHLAAVVEGDDDAQFAATVGGTENLLVAMRAAKVRILVLASSFTVYDWSRARSRLTEDSAIVEDVATLDRRGGYTVAKVWQERLVRRAADRGEIELTVLRPGFIWAAGREPLAGVGQSVGPLQLVIGPSRYLPLSYVENCADCFAAAVAHPDARGQTLNVVDDDHVTAWRFAQAYVRHTPATGRLVAVPYRLALPTVRLAQHASRAMFEHGGRLPSILVPERFEARFKPLAFPNERLHRVLGWRPPWSFEAALARTYSKGGLSAAEADSPH